MKNLLLRLISRKSLLYRLLKKINKRLKGKPQFDLLNAYVKHHPKINFLQIGSNNGSNGDPLNHFIKSKKWDGILIEPIPYLFEELKKNYNGHHQHLAYENYAVGLTNGTSKFYRLQKSDLENELPEWYDQLGSFNKDVVVKHKPYIPYFDDLFIEDEVKTITIKDLIAKHKVSSLNILHIDTEGFDHEIIKMIPFNTLKIDLILFEHRHSSDEEYSIACKTLFSNHYATKRYLGDTIAIRKDVLEKLNLGPKALKNIVFE